ncbi:FadR/GntR family transcriptional regulator [Paenibacillus eucommiae]|uniref:DNA-binding FadR family transcriptional regulator n=1 Tax=Paenibacillus eucommiae TaxID=1355755 RepID=A0ABS4IT95_9BACL|nr:GntR family transcriptional regulator [Paenibacillus eucommiae]MBP1990797.1 DNA-binding FadR family transcriptional regulator [Paenibacillus eucommiae]
MEPLQKNERYTLSQTVSEQLKQYIVDHRLLPGDKLPSERDMVKQMGVSRSVIREALRYLEISGIISIRHGEGAFIQEQDLAPLMEQLVFQWGRDLSAHDELLELRMMLELNAVELAVKNGTEEDFGVLEKLAQDMLSRSSDIDEDAGEKLGDEDTAFHRCLLLATHHQPFIQMTDPIISLHARLSNEHLSIARASNVHVSIASVSNKQLEDPEDPKTAQQAPGPLYEQFVEALRQRNLSEAKDLLRRLLS